MKKIATILTVLALGGFQAVSMSAEPKSDARDANGEKIEKPSHLKFYGFIRNYFTVDTRESKAGTKDLFYYLPKDESLNLSGEDMNKQTSFRYLALTSRLGLDIKDYQIGKTSVSAKLEADFYCMNGNVATFRMRQAYATLGWNELGKNNNHSASLKMGQAWHPMSVEQPYVVSLETGAPFNPFSRTPQATFDYNFGKSVTLTGALVGQMQYLSTGPNGASDNYMKYGCTPEFFAGIAVKTPEGFMFKTGVDVLSIKPRWRDGEGNKVNDRITTVTPFIYLQYTNKMFSINARTLYGSAGEHFNMLSGYGVTDIKDDAHWKYTPLHSSVSFVSVKYGKKVQIMGMLGYMKNLGTNKELYSDKGDGMTSTKYLYLSANGFPNLNSLVRITPTVVYNLGKLSFALEYDLTSAQYGRYSVENCVKSSNGLVEDDLHWVTNHRLLGMVKFTF